MTIVSHALLKALLLNLIQQLFKIKREQLNEFRLYHIQSLNNHSISVLTLLLA